MNKTIAITTALIGAAILGAITVSYSGAQSQNSQTSASSRADAQTEAATLETAFSNAQEDDIRALVRAYLLDNPEVIVESLQLYQERERLAVDQKYLDGARQNLTALIDDRDAFGAGADIADAKVAVIEFFDYHCGYCKRATGLVQDLTQADPEVRVLFREFPILRPESDIAAEYALAARRQNKYANLHFAMMSASGVLTEKRIKDIAKKQGLDVSKLEADRKSPAVSKALDETIRIARDMGVDGTPSFIVTTLDGAFVEVFPGYDADRLLAAIEEAKKAAG